MILELLKEPFLLLLTTLLTVLLGWFFWRKKAKAEVEGSQIENAEKLLEYYRKLADDLGQRLESAIQKFNDAENTINELEKKIDDLTTELRKYKQLNGKS